MARQHRHGFYLLPSSPSCVLRRLRLPSLNKVHEKALFLWKQLGKRGFQSDALFSLEVGVIGRNEGQPAQKHCSWRFVGC
jgi:hypothetical protein